MTSSIRMSFRTRIEPRRASPGTGPCFHALLRCSGELKIRAKEQVLHAPDAPAVSQPWDYTRPGLGPGVMFLMRAGAHSSIHGFKKGRTQERKRKGQWPAPPSTCRVRNLKRRGRGLGQNSSTGTPVGSVAGRGLTSHFRYPQRNTCACVRAHVFNKKKRRDPSIIIPDIEILLFPIP